jgi:hypothetical protein
MLTNKRLYILLLTIAGLLLSSRITNGQKTGAAHVTWEYKFIDLGRMPFSTFNQTTLPPLEVLSEDGRELKGDVTVHDRLAQLGAQGWELISVTSVSDGLGAAVAGTTTDLMYYLKRPKP